MATLLVLIILFILFTYLMIKYETFRNIICMLLLIHFIGSFFNDN